MSTGTKLPGTPEPMHFWEGSGGVRLAGDSWGEPAGPLVVLQHGGGQTRHAWKGTGELLASAGYHVIAFDARGHGDSDWAPDGHYGQNAMVADLKCVLAAFAGRRPVLVGASLGGGTSLVAVGENQVDATALVMVDIAPRIELEGFDKIQAFMSLQPEGFHSLQDVADAINSYQPHRAHRTNLDGLAKNVRLNADGTYRWHWDPRFFPTRPQLAKRQLRLEACAANLTLPTLLVRGGLSDVLSEEGAQDFLRRCRHAEYVNVADAGHMVAGDRNDVFSKSVIEFLSRVVPVSGSPVHPPQQARPHHESAANDDVIDVP